MKPAILYLAFLSFMLVACRPSVSVDQFVGQPLEALIAAEGPPQETTVINEKLTVYTWRRLWRVGRRADWCDTNVNVNADGVITSYNERPCGS